MASETRLLEGCAPASATNAASSHRASKARPFGRAALQRRFASLLERPEDLCPPTQLQAPLYGGCLGGADATPIARRGPRYNSYAMERALVLIGLEGNPLPSPYASAFEGWMYLLAGLALWRAWRTERGVGVVRLLVGIAYGVTLEAATIHQLEAYHYGRFWVMLPPGVPLAIGVGWGLILDAVTAYARAWRLSPLYTATLAGLLALNIDLAMDAVAIRLGFWDWGRGFDFQYFGVPWANFWAWFWVVAGFVAPLESLRRHPWLAPWAAWGLGLLVVLGTNALLVFGLLPLGLANEAVAVVLLTALGLGVRSRFWRKAQARPPRFSGAVARAFHGYFLGAGLASGVLLRTPALLATGLLMLLLAEGLYTYLPRRIQRA